LGQQGLHAATIGDETRKRDGAQTWQRAGLRKRDQRIQVGVVEEEMFQAWQIQARNQLLG